MQLLGCYPPLPHPTPPPRLSSSSRVTENLAAIYLPKVNNKNTIKRREICSKLTTKTTDGVVLVSLELTEITDMGKWRRNHLSS